MQSGNMEMTNVVDPWKGWRILIDRFYLFYYHYEKQISVWELPRELFPVLGEWKKIATKDGKRYVFLNCVTQMTLKDDPRRTCDIFTALLQGNLLFLWLFTECGGDLYLGHPETGATLLHYAVSGGSLPVLKYLLERMASGVGKSIANSSATHTGIHTGISSGAKRTSSGSSDGAKANPLGVETFSDSKFFASSSDRSSSEHSGERSSASGNNGDPKKLRKMVNTLDKDGFSPLAYALRAGQTHLLVPLCEAKADVEQALDMVSIEEMDRRFRMESFDLDRACTRYGSGSKRSARNGSRNGAAHSSVVKSLLAPYLKTDDDDDSIFELSCLNNLSDAIKIGRNRLPDDDVFEDAQEHFDEQHHYEQHHYEQRQLQNAELPERTKDPTTDESRRDPYQVDQSRQNAMTQAEGYNAVKQVDDYYTNPYAGDPYMEKVSRNGNKDKSQRSNAWSSDYIAKSSSDSTTPSSDNLQKPSIGNRGTEDSSFKTEIMMDGTIQSQETSSDENVGDNVLDGSGTGAAPIINTYNSSKLSPSTGHYKARTKAELGNKFDIESIGSGCTTHKEGISSGSTAQEKWLVNRSLVSENDFQNQNEAPGYAQKSSIDDQKSSPGTRYSTKAGIDNHTAPNPSKMGVDNFPSTADSVRSSLAMEGLLADELLQDQSQNLASQIRKRSTAGPHGEEVADHFYSNARHNARNNARNYAERHSSPLNSASQNASHSLASHPLYASHPLNAANPLQAFTSQYSERRRSKRRLLEHAFGPGLKEHGLHPGGLPHLGLTHVGNRQHGASSGSGDPPLTLSHILLPRNDHHSGSLIDTDPSIWDTYRRHMNCRQIIRSFRHLISALFPSSRQAVLDTSLHSVQEGELYYTPG